MWKKQHNICIALNDIVVICYVSECVGMLTLCDITLSRGFPHQETICTFRFQFDELIFSPALFFHSNCCVIEHNFSRSSEVEMDDIAASLDTTRSKLVSNTSSVM